MRSAPAKLQYAPAAAATGTSPGVWWLIIVLGFAARIVLACCSIGSDDAAAFMWFGGLIDWQGLFAAYQQNADFNHPPIPGLWAAAVVHVIGWLNLDPLDWFFLIFKLPAIAGDALSAFLLYRIWSRRDGRLRGLCIAAIFSWALPPMLVSGYHLNTDTIYAALSLLAVYLLEDRRRPLLAGLALAAAINIKIIPVLLVPALLASLRDRREIIRFLAGLSVGVIPFIPLLIVIGPTFYQNALAYNPKPNRWGIMLPFTWWHSVNEQPPETVFPLYQAIGRYLILALIAGWTILSWRLRRWNRYEMTAVCYAIFLVFTPGFGVQYTVCVVPLLFATPIGARWLGAAYSTIAGLCLGTAYVLFWDGNWPWGSVFGNYLPRLSASFGFAAWLVLGYFLWKMVSRSTGNAASASPPIAASAVQKPPITR